jgi:microcystin-dependent protein
MNRTRTEAFDSIKTRQLIYQNPDGSFPPAGSIFTVASSAGAIGFATDIGVSDLSANTITVQDISTTTIVVNDITVQNVVVEDISGETASITNLTVQNVVVEDISGESASIANLTVQNVVVEDISGEAASITNLTVQNVVAADISGETASITNLTVQNVMAADISGESASIMNLTVQTIDSADISAGILRVADRIEGPLDVSGSMSVDILNVRRFINDVDRTSSISTDTIRTKGLLVGSEDANITPEAAIHVLGGLVKVEGNISCNTLSYGTLNPDVVHSVSTPADSGVSIGGTAANPTISVFVRGMIMMFSGAAAPSGWAFCNGTNGTPDLRDRFIVGAGSTYTQGDTGGAASVTLTTAQLPVHKHTITDPGHTHSTKGYWNVGSATGDSKQAASVSSVDYPINTDFDVVYSATTGITETNNEGSGNSHENRPPYYALAFIMKL